METDHKIMSQVGRAIFHGSIGIIAIIFGMVLPLRDGEKVTVALVFGGVISFFDICIRIPLYHFFVRNWKDTGQPRFRVPWLSRTFLFLEKWLLIKTGVIRKSERGKPATAIHFTLGIIIPLVIGVPLWAVVPAVVIFAFGDPAARLSGIAWGKKLVWEGGTKTWVGAIFYFYLGLITGLITVVLDRWFPLYPPQYSELSIIGAVIAATLVSAYFESLCEKGTTLFAELLDDNFLAPFSGSMAFYAFATAGN